jgi:ABC-2 type transport system ATP-binding protein
MIDKGKEVVSGSLQQIKDAHGKRAVLLEYDGDSDFIEGMPEVAGIIKYPRWIEVDLAQGASSDRLLSQLSGRVSIRRFEVANPSLHKIFVDLAGKKPEEAPDE